METISMLIASNKNWTLAQQKNLEKNNFDFKREKILQSTLNSHKISIIYY